MKNIVIKWAVFLTAFLISLEVSITKLRKECNLLELSVG